MIPSGIRVNNNLKSNVSKIRVVNPHVNQFASISKRCATTFKPSGTDNTFKQKDNIDQTNLHGKQSSTPPSGHSYGSSDKKYSQYAGQDENKTQGYSASGSSTTNWTPGGGAPASSTASPASGGQGTNWPSGQTGGTAGDAGTAGTQKTSSTKPGDSKDYYPPPFATGKDTDSKTTDAWAQSEYASGKSDTPPKGSYEKKEDTDKDEDKSMEAYDVDYTKQQFSTKAQPEISDDTSFFAQMQSNKKESEKTQSFSPKDFVRTTMPEVTTSGTTSEEVKKGGVESQYDQRQFNNAFSDLQKKAPSTADAVADAARMASQMMSGKQHTEQKDKGFYDIGEIHKKEGETEGRTDSTLLRAGTGGKEATKMKGKDYENQVKGLEHKDDNYYAETLKRGSEKTDKLKDAYSQVDSTPKDYEHKVKGTRYNEMSDEDQIYNTSFDPSHAKDAREAVENVANKAGDMAKDTANWVGSKANDAKEKLGVKDSSWLGETVNTVEEKAKDTAKWMGEKAKDTYNMLEEKAKETFHTVDEKAKDTYRSAEDKAKGAYDSAKGAYNAVEEKAKETYKSAEDKAKGAYNAVEEKAKDTYKSAEDKAKDTYDSAKHMSKEAMDDITAGQRTVPGRQPGEERTITGDDSMKQDSGHQSSGINMHSVASFTQDIVNKVKETAETVKEKVGHIFSNETPSDKHVSHSEGQSAVQQNKRSSDYPNEWENDQNPPVNTGTKKPFGSNPNASS